MPNITPFQQMMNNYQLLKQAKQSQQPGTNQGNFDPSSLDDTSPSTGTSSSPTGDVLTTYENNLQQSINWLSYQGISVPGVTNTQLGDNYGNAVDLILDSLSNYDPSKGFSQLDLKPFEDALGAQTTDPNSIGMALRHLIYDAQTSNDPNLGPLTQLSGCLFKDNDVSLDSLFTKGFLNALNSNSQGLLATSLANAGLSDYGNNPNSQAMSFLSGIASDTGPQGQFAQQLFSQYQTAWSGQWDTDAGKVVQGFLSTNGITPASGSGSSTRDLSQIETDMKEASTHFPDQDPSNQIQKNDTYAVQDGDTLNTITQAFSADFGVSQQNQAALEQVIAKQLNLDPTQDGDKNLLQSQGFNLNLTPLYQFITPPAPPLSPRNINDIENQMKAASYGWKNTDPNQPKNDQYIIRDGDSVKELADAYVAVFGLAGGQNEQSLEDAIAAQLKLTGTDYNALNRANGQHLDQGALYTNFTLGGAGSGAGQGAGGGGTWSPPDPSQDMHGAITYYAKGTDSTNGTDLLPVTDTSDAFIQSFAQNYADIFGANSPDRGQGNGASELAQVLELASEHQDEFSYFKAINGKLYLDIGAVWQDFSNGNGFSETEIRLMQKNV